ncbi:MAG: ATP synthase F1 subunit epsilon [Bacteroidales bacterium]
MTIEIISPEKLIYKGEITLAQLPGSDGSFEILKNHAPLIATLKEGRIRLVKPEGNTEYVEIKGGTIEVLNNKLLILAV